MRSAATCRTASTPSTGLPGVVGAYMLGLPLAVGAFASGLFCATATGWIKSNTRIKEDTVMGIVFTGLFAFGLVLFTKVETEAHLNHILFGNILGIGWGDVLETGIIAAIACWTRWTRILPPFRYCPWSTAWPMPRAM